VECEKGYRIDPKSKKERCVVDDCSLILFDQRYFCPPEVWNIFFPSFSPFFLENIWYYFEIYGYWIICFVSVLSVVILMVTVKLMIIVWIRKLMKKQELVVKMVYFCFNIIFFYYSGCYVENKACVNHCHKGYGVDNSGSVCYVNNCRFLNFELGL
jgi:hypothetical protein